MAKRGKKAARKARPAAKKVKSFRMVSIEPLFNRLLKRRDKAKEVVAALQNGGRAVLTPRFRGSLSDMEKATRVADNLALAVQALSQTCPNDLASNFKIEVDADRKRARPRR